MNHRRSSTLFSLVSLLVIPQIVSIGSPLEAFSSSSSARSIAALSVGGLTALDAPIRLLDTRTSGTKVGALDGAGSALELSVAGMREIPSSGVSAVAMNVTVVDGETGKDGGYVTVYPCGTRPDASNLNFVNGQTVPNAVIAPLSADGKVCFYVYGKAHLLGDVSAYFTAGFTALTPTRVLDTRSSGLKLTNGSTYALTVSGQGGLPTSGAFSSVAMNVTVVDGEVEDSSGYVTVYPCGTARPDASNLNFVNGQTVPNAVIAPVSADGKVCFFVAGKAHLLADVSGYFDSSLSTLAVPTRLLNTRTSGIKVGALGGAGSALELSVAGVREIPSSGVSAVAMNVTVVDGEAGQDGGYVTVYPCGNRPNASNLNFVNGQTVPNAVIAPLSASGKVCFYVYGKAHLLVDVSGYFVGSGGSLPGVSTTTTTTTTTTTVVPTTTTVVPTTTTVVPTTTTVVPTTTTTVVPLIYRTIGVSYRGNDNLTVTLNSLTKTEQTGSYSYTLNYTLKNENPDTQIDQGTWKIFESDGGGTPQYGSFSRLFYDDTRNRTYTFVVLKTVSYVYVAYHSDIFFEDLPPSNALVYQLP